MPSRSTMTVRRSSIHGRGVFATAPIGEGARLGEYEGPETQENDSHVLWVEDERGREVGIRGTNALRFINHSAEPNVEFRGAELYALRRIEAGEELTADYGDDWADVPG